MMEKKNVRKLKRLPKGERTHARRIKQAARKDLANFGIKKKREYLIFVESGK